MIGMDAGTGAALGGLDHIHRSIRRIIATPAGTRVMRRAFAGHVGDLVDRPADRATVLRLFAAAADALDRWEPRVRLQALALDAAGPDGRAVLTLALTLTEAGLRAVPEAAPEAGAGAGAGAGARLDVPL